MNAVNHPLFPQLPLTSATLLNIARDGNEDADEFVSMGVKKFSS
jgi:hypothetical protein